MLVSDILRIVRVALDSEEENKGSPNLALHNGVIAYTDEVILSPKPLCTLIERKNIQKGREGTARPIRVADKSDECSLKTQGCCQSEWHSFKSFFTSFESCSRLVRYGYLLCC